MSYQPDLSSLNFQGMPVCNDIRQAQQGFTLIEVMVALAILAVVSVVASQASGTYLRSVDNLKTRTLGHFVAQNTAANLQIDTQWIQSPSVTQLSSQGRQWQVTITPMSMQEAFANGAGNSPYASLQEYIRPVSIQIAPVSQQGGQVQRSITDLSVMISNPQYINAMSVGNTGQ